MRHSVPQNSYCLPIVKNSVDAITAMLEKGAPRYRYLEVWLDYVPKVEPQIVANLVGTYPGRLVFVFRRKNLEAMKMNPEHRFKIISSLSRKQAFVDLDISLQADEITKLIGERLAVKTILSYHNYSFTPSDTELRTITERMRGWKAHIIKVSTLCKSERDSLRVLSLLLDVRESGEKCIIIGMGTHGLVTRIFGLEWGNEMTFAPLDEADSSAPGQITVDRLSTIVENLVANRGR